MKTELINNLEKRLTLIKDGIAKAHEPKAEWSQYNGTIQQQKFDEQVKAGIATAEGKLFEIGFEIDMEVKRNQTQIAGKLYPDFEGTSDTQKRRGESNRQYCFTLVYKLQSVKQLKTHYEEAMKMNDTDLATRLIEAGEMRFNSVAEKETLAEMKRQHVEELDLSEILTEKEQLKAIQKSFAGVKRDFSVGIYKPFSEATTLAEHTQMLFKAGLAV